MIDPRKLLEGATNILLVDWPDQGVPRKLLEAGFTVFGYSPDKYSNVELDVDEPTDSDEKSVYAPRASTTEPFLVIRPFEGKPDSIDIVNVFRPDSELGSIIDSHLKPLGATVLWMQTPGVSEHARRLAAEHDLILVEALDITKTAQILLDE